MGRQIIKQPNGLYAVFSSIVDDFILVDATPQDIIDDWAEESRKEIYEKVIKIVDALDNGEKPYHQFTMSFDEAIEMIKEIHGSETESLGYFSQKNQRIDQPPMTLSCCICQQSPRYQIRPGVYSNVCSRQQCLRAHILREPWRCPKCQSMDFRRLETLEIDKRGRKLYWCGKCKGKVAVKAKGGFEVLAVHDSQE